jgi:hypothetical protein
VLIIPAQEEGLHLFLLEAKSNRGRETPSDCRCLRSDTCYYCLCPAPVQLTLVLDPNNFQVLAICSIGWPGQPTCLESDIASCSYSSINATSSQYPTMGKGFMHARGGWLPINRSYSGKWQTVGLETLFSLPELQRSVHPEVKQVQVNSDANALDQATIKCFLRGLTSHWTLLALRGSYLKNHTARRL